MDARFPMERSASTEIRNPSVTLHKQACKMLSQCGLYGLVIRFRKVTRDCCDFWRRATTQGRHPEESSFFPECLCPRLQSSLQQCTNRASELLSFQSAGHAGPTWFLATLFDAVGWPSGKTCGAALQSSIHLCATQMPPLSQAVARNSMPGRIAHTKAATSLSL